MKKLTIIAAATLSLLPFAVRAEAPKIFTFQHDGARYIYTITEKGSTRTIRGWDEASKTPFFLRVGKTRVTGTVGGSTVSFLLKDVKPLKGTVEVAVK